MLKSLLNSIYFYNAKRQVKQGVFLVTEKWVEYILCCLIVNVMEMNI